MFDELSPVVRVKARRTSRTSALSGRLACEAAAAGSACADAASDAPVPVCAFANVAQTAMPPTNIATIQFFISFAFMLALL
ncbi:hypothetical protein [Paraburkholderia mimosarum]|uniref:hypothetical protein n=1 Tax=Paraburkholderia mimosarum TaxID=312026 RepID=UPI00307C82DC